MRKFLISLNIITISILLFISIKENYFSKIYYRLNPQKASFINYYDNPKYSELNSFFSKYYGQKNIVMLGNSLTERINWNELLNRNDIANRGIGSDITKGYINRLEFIFNVNPKICFIEGGINDLKYNVSIDEICSNLYLLIDTLNSRNIKPVLTSVIYVTKGFEKSFELNSRVKKLNYLIQKFATDNKIDFIDLNILLSKNDYLLDEYAIKDGVHLNGDAYTKWGEEVLKIIRKYKI